MKVSVLTMTTRALFSWLSLCALFPALGVGIELNPIDAVCSDYEMLIVNTNKCVSRCPIICNRNRVCYEDGPCPCENSYQSTVKGLTCAMDCLPGCKSAGGHCAAPDLCLCRKGFYFNKVARRCWKQTLFRDRCLGRCLYGTCTSDGMCICAQGYEQPSGNFTHPIRRFLGQLCVPSCRQNCGLLGYCLLPNMCACRKKHFHYESDGKCHKDPVYLG